MLPRRPQVSGRKRPRRADQKVGAAPHNFQCSSVITVMRFLRDWDVMGGAEKERRPPVLPRRPQVDREETPKKG